MTASAPLIDFLTTRKIRWQPIRFKSGGVDRHKTPSTIRGTNGKMWCPKMTDFYGAGKLSDDELAERQRCFPEPYDHIAIDTTRTQQIDIDVMDESLFQNCDRVEDLAIHMIQCKITPWYKSMTKQLPHIFVNLENAALHGKRDVAHSSNKIDVLCGQWAFARRDAEVYNADADIQMLPESYTKSGHRRITANADRVVNFSANMSTRHDVPGLLGLLSVDRAAIYGQWIEVGIVLKCLGRLLGDTEMLALWTEWSSQVPCTEPDLDHQTLCGQKWTTFVATNRFSVATLHYMAKLDKPSEYASRFATSSNAADQLGIYNIEAEVEAKQVAEFLVSKYKHRYVTVPSSNATPLWYEFHGHRWHEIGMTPASFIVEVIGREFQTMLDDSLKWHNQLGTGEVAEGPADEESNGSNGSTDPPELMKIFPQLVPKSIAKLHKLIGNFPTMLSVVKAAAVLLLDPDFVNRLDDCHHLLGFENGVYDLDAAEFRNGRPEDCISISTGYDYVSEVDANIREQIMQFKLDIMGSEEMCDFLLDTEAYALHGDTWIQHMYVHTGNGGNGKSVNGVLLRKTFGGYFYAPDVSMFTGKRSVGGGTSSELVKAKGRRMLLSTEPEAGDTLQAARIKYFTGGEVIQARAIYRLPIEFLPQFTINLQMNQLPNLSNFDGGIARRMKVIPYPHQFVNEPTLEHHRKIDLQLGQRLGSVEYAQQYMLILIERFKERLAGHRVIHVPATADECTNEYMEEEDSVGEFVRTMIIQTGDPTDRVGVSELYTRFKDSGYGRPDVTLIQFGRKCKEAGLRKRRTNNGYSYRGIKIAMTDGGMD